MVSICGGGSIQAGNSDSGPDNGGANDLGRANDPGPSNDPHPDLGPDPNLAVFVMENKMTVRIVTMNRMTAIAHLDNTCFSPSFPLNLDDYMCIFRLLIACIDF